MVKLIAADMDGTLLDDQKRLPNGFPKLLECLAKRGVAFAVASGRSYPALQMLFGKKTEELLLICDNGAHTCGFRGKHLFISVCRFLWCMRY